MFSNFPIVSPPLWSSSPFFCIISPPTIHLRVFFIGTALTKAGLVNFLIFRVQFPIGSLCAHTKSAPLLFISLKISSFVDFLNSFSDVLFFRFLHNLAQNYAHFRFPVRDAVLYLEYSFPLATPSRTPLELRAHITFYH